MSNYIYLITVFCWWLTNIALLVQIHAILQDSLPGVQQGLPFCATRIDFVPVHTFSLRSASFHVNLDLQTGLRPSDFRGTLCMHFLVCPCVLRAPPKTFSATKCCQNNLRETESAKQLVQFTFCLFAGDVHQTLPAVRRLQKGGGCWSPSLHGVRH
jgi:hypothetical protein